MASTPKSSLAMVLSGGILLGTIPVFATFLSSSGVNAEVQVVWRLALGAPVLILAALAAYPREVKGVRSSDLVSFLGIGVTVLGMFLLYIESIALGTPVATAVLLLYSQPVFTVLLSGVFLDDPEERITTTRLITLFLGISGLFLVLNPLEFNNGAGVGQALALSAGFLYAVYLIAIRRIAQQRVAEKTRFHALTMTSLSFGAALVILLPLASLLQILAPQTFALGGVLSLDVGQTGQILGLVCFGTILPYLAINYGLEKIRASDAGITLLVEPVSVMALGSLVLGQGLRINQVTGGALIIVSIAVLHKGSSLGERVLDVARKLGMQVPEPKQGVIQEAASESPPSCTASD